jgi:hypothetical protein
VLKLFGGGKPDHPMAAPKEARRILEELNAQDAFKALDELSHWHESVASAEGFKPEARVQLLMQIDEAAQPRVRKLSRDYFATSRPSRVLESRLWTHIHEYWRLAGQAFGRCLDQAMQDSKFGDALKAHMPLLVARALRSLGQRIKWMHLRYGPVDAAAWGVLNAIYAFAEPRNLAGARVGIYPQAGETTPKQEFMRAVMFSASSPDTLLPLEVELAERLIGDLDAAFTLATQAAPELAYWTDLAKPMAPLRINRSVPVAGPTTRYVGGGAALTTLQGHIQKIEATGRIPAGLNLGGTYEPEVALDLMQHLAMYWSPVPPERRHPRHNVKSRLSIAQGFEGVAQALEGNADVALEAWIVENVSAGGFGAMVPQIKGDWLKVGALLAMQPEGGKNWIAGAVRRVNKTSGQQARVGIQTLSRSPVAMRFSMRGSEGEPGILLPGDVPGSNETCIALNPAVFVQGINLEAQRAGRQHVFMPLGLAERGDDYELVRFREMVRDD